MIGLLGGGFGTLVFHKLVWGMDVNAEPVDFLPKWIYELSKRCLKRGKGLASPFCSKRPNLDYSAVLER